MWHIEVHSAIVPKSTSKEFACTKKYFWISDLTWRERATALTWCCPNHPKIAPYAGTWDHLHWKICTSKTWNVIEGHKKWRKYCPFYANMINAFMCRTSELLTQVLCLSNWSFWRHKNVQKSWWAFMIFKTKISSFCSWFSS